MKISRFASLSLFSVFLIASVFLYQQQHQRIFEDQGRLSVSQEGNAVVLEWHTGIEQPMELRFSEAFEEWADKTDTFIIDLHSNGGALQEGGRIIELINAMKKNHHMITRVTGNNHCLSMCVPIFLSGEERIASATSRWMFHEPQSYDYFDGSKASQPEFERQYYANRFFDKYFVKSVIDPAWRDRLRQEWVGQDVWRSGQQLFDERSNIVTRLGE